jgi:AraC family transcriptional activator of pobA
MLDIPVHKLYDKTDIGFELKRFVPEDNGQKKSEYLGAHRDDHYIFFLITKGVGSAVVDFEEKIIIKNQLYFILPEQIHYRITTNKVEGWFIAVDPSLIDPVCRSAFESWSGFQVPVTLSLSDVSDMDQLLAITYQKQIKYQKHGPGLSLLHSLLRAFFEMAAINVRSAATFDKNNTRAAELSLQFKKLLNENFKQHKKPSDYAGMLHISEPYLNESLKKFTGSSVSYWIRYTTTTEAKRLLYFTDMTIKQIAIELGFENYSYFSRLFCKEAGVSALAFRKKIRGAEILM